MKSCAIISKHMCRTSESKKKEIMVWKHKSEITPKFLNLLLKLPLCVYTASINISDIAGIFYRELGREEIKP